MHLRLSNEQELLRDSARRYLADHLDYARRTEIARSPDGYSREIWRAFAGLGWLGLPLPEHSGGFGGNDLDVAIVMIELGRSLALEPYLPAIATGARLVADLDGGAPLLASIVAGETLLVAADGEGRWGAPLTTVARSEGGSWRLSGTKRTVLGADGADLLAVSALTENGPGIFIVDPGSGGVTLDRFSLVDDRRAAHVQLDGANGARLGGDAGAALAAMRERALVAASAYMLGGLEELVAQTRSYCETRIQFGKPLLSFQVIRHRLAEMAVSLAEARAALLLACLRDDAAAPVRARAASAAKAKVGRAARLIAREAVQLHGGMGVTEELSIGAYYKHMMAFDALFGTAEQHEALVGASVRTERAGADPIVSQAA